jgi:hypothetical protein
MARQVYLCANRETTKICTTPNPPGVPTGSASILTKRLRESDLGGDLEGLKITLNEYLDRWFEVRCQTQDTEKTLSFRIARSHRRA